MRALAEAGFDTVAAARRLERLEALAAEVGGRALRLDVADPDSVDGARRRGCRGVDVDRPQRRRARSGSSRSPRPTRTTGARCGSRTSPGVMRVTKALLPALRRGATRSIVIVGSVAGVEVYEGGGGYTAAKHAAHALAQTLRLELLARRDPGDRGRARDGRDRVLARPLRGRRRARRGRLRRARRRSPAPTSPRRSPSASPGPPHVDIDYLAIKPTAAGDARRSPTGATRR